MSLPSTRHSPVRRVPGMRSFIRLNSRRKVDLPHPEGPMKAVTVLLSMVMLMFFSAWKSP